MNHKWLLKLIGYWPPYLGTGISVRDVADDLSYIKVRMKLHFWNRNYVGTHFGGSLYTMTDPFYMLMLLKRMGSQYIVWDKSAKIRYRKAVKHTVYAHFKLSNEQIERFKQALQNESKIEPIFHINIVDIDGQVVAEVEKTLHIQKKPKSEDENP